MDPIHPSERVRERASAAAVERSPNAALAHNPAQQAHGQAHRGGHGFHQQQLRPQAQPHAASSPPAPVRASPAAAADDAWPTVRTVRHYLVRLLKLVVESTAYGVGSAIGQLAVYKLHVLLRDSLSARAAPSEPLTSSNPSAPASASVATPTSDRISAATSNSKIGTRPSGSASVVPMASLATASQQLVHSAGSGAAPRPPSAQSVALTALAAAAMSSTGFHALSP